MWTQGLNSSGQTGQQESAVEPVVCLSSVLSLRLCTSSVPEPDLHILCPQATASPLMRLDLYLCEWVTKQKNKHFPLQTSKQLFQHHVGTV